MSDNRLEFVWRDGTTHNTPPPDLLMDWTRGELIDEIERLRARPCPYVRTSGEGTSYCSLGTT
jgi:hypothetical protein